MSDFDVGDVVVCVDNTVKDDPDLPRWVVATAPRWESLLIVGKLYTITHVKKVDHGFSCQVAELGYLLKPVANHGFWWGLPQDLFRKVYTPDPKVADELFDDVRAPERVDA